MQATPTTDQQFNDQLLRYICEPYVVVDDMALVVALNDAMCSLLDINNQDALIGCHLDRHMKVKAPEADDEQRKCVFPLKSLELVYNFEQIDIGNKLTCLIIQKSRDEEHANLQEYEQRFRDVFNGASTGVAITDRFGHFLEVNNTFC